MEKQEVKKYLIVAILLIIAYLAYLIIKPFIAAILTSFVLAYLFFPVHKKLTKLSRSEIISAAITTILVIVVTLLPTIYIANSLVKESLNIYREGLIDETTKKLSESIKESTLTEIINTTLDKLITYSKQQAADFISKIPSKLFDLLITVYTTFAFLLLGKKFVNKTKLLLPVKKKDELISHLGNTTHAIVYGMFVTAIIEFILSLIAFKIIGTNAALLLAIIIGFLAFIPFLGPTVIWIPYAIIEILRNNTKSAIVLIILGIILFVIETFVKPHIIGDRSKLHPVIILVGTFGGIKLFGFIGLVIGPILLSSILVIIREYYPEVENEI
ncbi:AI-2E family transporter [Candidatus Woesearchaeota archaeon]|nr:AI-2E family transporter [Candidatus Woesearchaeota archaeon]